MTEDCLHSEYVTCGLCKPTKTLAARKLDRPVAAIDSRFDSECDRCDGAIFKGDRIGMTREGEWIHIEHFESEEVEKIKEKPKWR